MVTVAYGYFAMIDAEAIAAISGRPFQPTVEGRSAEQVWPYWVATMGTGVRLTQMTGKKEIGKVQNICGESLYQGLRDLGLVGKAGAEGSLTWGGSMPRRACCSESCKATRL